MKYFRGLISLLLGIFIFGCSIGVYNYPRTVEKDRLSLNVGYFATIRDSYSYIYGPYVSVVGYPEIFLRYGLEDNLDVGLRLFGLGFLSDVKYQFLGDKESFLASSFDLEFGATYLPFPLNYYSYSPSMIFNIGVATLFDVMWIKLFSTYFGLKFRFTYSIFSPPYFTGSDNLTVPSPVGILFIGIFGISFLNGYNYGVNFELSFMKSLLSDAWGVSPSLIVRVKF